MSDWYYAADNQQKGPINESELKAHFATNHLPADTLVWKEGMENWTAANQLPAFTFRPPPAPAKVQPPATPAAAASQSASSSTTPVDVASLLTAKGEALEVDPDDAEKNKVFGILAYLGILFLVPLLAAKDSPFAKYHANQGLVLFILWIVLFIGIGVINAIIQMVLHSDFGLILSIAWLGYIILVIMGIINAAAGKCVPLPVIGGIKLIK